jgi:hypothetical protein
LVTATKQRRLRDAYRFAGFRPIEQVRGVFGDPHARIVALVRRSKNQLRHVQARAFRMVRSQASARSGSSDRRLAHIPGVRGAARQVPALRQGEARATRILGEQSALYQAVCVLCRPALPVCTENLIRVYDVVKSLKLAERSGCSVSFLPSWPRHSSRSAE